MLSLTLSDMDTFNFLSAVVKGGEVALPYLFRKAIGNALLPDIDLEGQEERGADIIKTGDRFSDKSFLIPDILYQCYNVLEEPEPIQNIINSKPHLEQIPEFIRQYHIQRRRGLL